jgi:hypothetical protein
MPAGNIADRNAGLHRLGNNRKLQPGREAASAGLNRRDSFPDADVLLAECSRRGLEGIVAKRKDSVYRSGTHSGWVKVKTSEWRADNRWRGEVFEKR